MMKSCYGCEIAKPTTEFSKCSSRADGLQTQCKTCQNERRRRRYRAHKPDELKACRERRVAAMEARGGCKGQRGENNNNWRGGEVSYAGAHRRIKADKGGASNYLCADCGEFANHWSYDHECLEEKQSDDGPYSLDFDRYQPRCFKCHNAFDQNRSRLVSA